MSARAISTVRPLIFLLAIFCLAGAVRAAIPTLEDVSPDSSNNSNPNAASGGRVNGIAIDPGNPAVMYAASEWGGLYKSVDSGTTWSFLKGHRALATWDVKVDPSDSNRVYATSFYDGRSPSLSGINVSTDGGQTWTHPATAVPPAGFCANAADRTEQSAFGIAISSANPANVYIGTSCGLAISTNSGVTWTYSAPGAGNRIWSVIVAPDESSVDTCGDNGHFYRDSMGSWAAGSGLPSGICSIAASPYGSANFNMFATVGNKIYETEDGVNWTETRTNPKPQGRVPFVKTNKRSLAPAGRVFDLWFGDVSLYRVQCDMDAVGPNCGTGTTPAWSGPYSNTVGAHNDVGSIAFDPSAANDACPVLTSSDGGVYLNTLATSPACHAPTWQAPTKTPHALWPWDLSGANLSGANDDHVYVANQDTGIFGTTNAGVPAPTWSADTCCDVIDVVGSDFGTGSVIYSAGFYSPGRGFLFFQKNADFSNGVQINAYPSGGLPVGWSVADALARWGDKKYAMLTADCTAGVDGCPAADGGLYITQDITATPIVWTELGNASEPQNLGYCGTAPTTSCTGAPGQCPAGDSCFVPVAPCGVYTPANAAVFYEQIGACNSDSGLINDWMFKYTGTAPGGTWTQVNLPNREGFGAFAVDPANGNRLLAVGLTATDAIVYLSTDGGANWTALSDLNTKLRGGGTFPILNQRGPTNFTGMGGYYQPSLVAFDPIDSRILVAGGRDSGLFISRDSGATWTAVSDPLTSHTSAIPHVPRPFLAYFSEADHNKSVYIGSQGRGVWRMNICKADAFENDDAAAPFIIPGVPQDRSICSTGNRDTGYFIVNENSAVTIRTSGTEGDTTLTLLDINGAQIAFDDDSGDGNFSLIERSCATGSVLPAGTYFVYVDEFQSNDTIAAYQLRVDIVPCCGNGAVDPGEGCDDGNEVEGDCCSAACVTAPLGSACNDSNGCTVSDTCKQQLAELFDTVAAPALPAGWASSGTGNLWRTVVGGADTPPNFASADDPGVVSDKVLDSPPIAITSAAATLSFRNAYNTESTYDGGVLELKIGAGPFQDILTAGGSFFEGGYNDTISTGTGSPIAGRQAWSGDSFGFLTTTVNLPAAAAGQSCVLRWRMTSDSSVGDVGWIIDTVKVFGGGAGSACAGTPIAAPPSVGTISAAANKQSYSWAPAAGATRYDVVRGATNLFPVGPGGIDELCGSTASPTFNDTATPALGSGYWYLSRAANTCGASTYGNGVTYPGAIPVPRVTSTCP